ncbi:hypothetical protein FKK32_29290 [Klebsiella pneumoniae]|nr:hypothetical protein [Klebsiella pneumoniae]
MLTVSDALALPDEARKRLAPDLSTFYSRIGISGCLDDAKLRALESVLFDLHDRRRDESEEIELLEKSGLDASHLLFASWMGLVNTGPDGAWRMPALYLNLVMEGP